MMTLYNHTRYTQTLDTVWIDGSLSKPFGIGYLLCFSIKYFNEITTDNLTFLFRLCNPFKIFEELLTRIYANNIKTQSLIVFHHLFKLVFTQHAMINEYTGEVLSYCLV